MASIKELLDGLGITPQTVKPGPSRVSDFVAQSPQAQAARAAALLQLAQPSTPQMGGVSGGNGNPLAGFNGVGIPAPKADDGGFGLGDIGSFLKDDVLGNALKFVDTGRATIGSFVKEINDELLNTDAAKWLGSGNHMPDWLITQRSPGEWDQFIKDSGAQGGFEFNDLRDQIRRHAGIGDYMNQYNKQGGSWKNRIVGFAGDVAADPLTYVTLGGSKAVSGTARAAGERVGLGLADEAAEKAVLAAVKHGGRKELAEAVAKKAVEAGLVDDVAVQALIRDAGNRGLGAITARGLRRAGIDAAKAEALSIPSLERSFLGVGIKGTGGIANAVEDFKGAIKEAIGTSSAAKVGRALRISDKYGEKRLMDVIRSGATDPERAALAVRMLSINSEAKLAGRGWGAQVAMAMKNDLKGGMRALGKDEGGAVTDLIESGVREGALGDLAEKTNGVFQKVLNDLQEAGVDIGELQGGLNYVPHMSTRAARLSENPEIKDIVVDRQLGDRRAFQRARQLKAGSTFLGETLQTGSIKEINSISEKQLGFKVFEDDIREILPRYIAQAQEAMVDQHIRNQMVDQGVATEKRLKLLLTDDEKAALAKAEKEAQDAWGEQTLKLSDGTDVRYKSIGTVRKYLREQRKALEGELERLRVAKVANERNRTMWTERTAQLRQEIPLAEKSLEYYKAAASKARGAERAAALRKLRSAEAALAVKSEELRVLEGRLSKLPPMEGNVEDWAARNNVDELTAGRDATAPRVAQLEAQVAANRADHEALLQAGTPLGERQGIPEEELYARGKAAIDFANREVGINEGAVLDSRWQDVSFDDKITVAEKRLEDVNKALDAAKRSSKMVKPTKRNAIGAADHAALRDEFTTIIDVMKRVAPSDNAGLKAMMEAQLDGALQDMAALRAGRKAMTAQDVVKAMKSPDFGSKMKWITDHGMWDLPGKYQAPGWLEDIYKTQAMIRDPKHFQGFADVFNWFQNQWKGYATMRPGFVARNAYSSTYSFYLEAGSAKAVKSALRDFKSFYTMFKNNPEKYMDLATERFGVETAQRLDTALKVVAGTGGGLAPQEVASNVFRKGTANPFSSEFHGIRATRALNEQVEATIRGAHAYDVLRRGGDGALAMDTVEKWHFNYKDITDFDRAVKKVIPFWMFYSNNLALQAHVFTHDLATFNRSYMNLRRQMQIGQPEEQDAPDYVGGINQLPLSINPQGESTYMPIDVGPTQFLNDIGTIGDPKKMVSDIGLSPLVGLPLQTVAGENLFTGAPNDRLVGADPLSNLAMPWLQEGASGNGVMSQFQKDAVYGLLPGFAQGGRMTQQVGAGNGVDWLSGYLGFPVTTVTEKQRKGVRYGRDAKAKAAKAKREMLAKL